MCKRDGEKHADISHHGMVRDGLSTREKASTGADFIAFPITPQHRSMRTPKVIADHPPGGKLISAVSSKKEPKSSILYKSS